MDKEDYYNKNIGSYVNDEESMFDVQGELINALGEIDRLNLKKRKQKTIVDVV